VVHWKETDVPKKRGTSMFSVEFAKQETSMQQAASSTIETMVKEL
jgi:hypothetical protein